MFSSCSQMACENGATCQDQGPNSVCICKPGFTGQRCELGMIEKDIHIFM